MRKFLWVNCSFGINHFLSLVYFRSWKVATWMLITLYFDWQTVLSFSLRYDLIEKQIRQFGCSQRKSSLKTDVLCVRAADQLGLTIVSRKPWKPLCWVRVSGSIAWNKSHEKGLLTAITVIHYLVFAKIEQLGCGRNPV